MPVLPKDHPGALESKYVLTVVLAVPPVQFTQHLPVQFTQDKYMFIWLKGNFTLQEASALGARRIWRSAR